MIQRFMQSLGRLWTSVSFRLTLNYGLLAIVTTLLLLFFIYFQVLGALHTQRFRQIENTAQRLQVVHEEGGRADLVRALELTLSDRIDSSRELYLLLDEEGERLVGNFDRPPRSFGAYHGIFEASIVQDGRHVLGHLKTLSFPDGLKLLVGHDSSEIDDVMSLIARSVAAAVVVALLLIGVGVYIFRRELDYRVGTIRRTAEKIGSGQLSERIPLSSVDDEFTHLSRDINTMLDRIEVLMKGVRHVSDTIAHNLRTPMMRILGHLRTAQQPGRSVADVLAANQYAIDEIDNLNVLFGKLLQIAEMEAGVQRQTFRQCRLDVIAADVVDMYEAYAEDRNVALSLSASEECVVHGDPDLIASALANLVDNAVKYACSTVHVSVAQQDGAEACVVVQDDGPGVPSADLVNIEKHFYRLDPSTPGHGLGLASVRAIVGLHDGSLRMTNTFPGLQARMSLPLST